MWLSTDQGRLRAASQSLDKLDGELADVGFLRVHRRYLVNLSRIREIERGLKGELSLVMDDRTHQMLPVSRRTRRPYGAPWTSEPSTRSVSRKDSPCLTARTPLPARPTVASGGGLGSARAGRAPQRRDRSPSNHAIGGRTSST